MAQPKCISYLFTAAAWWPPCKPPWSAVLQGQSCDLGLYIEAVLFVQVGCHPVHQFCSSIDLVAEQMSSLLPSLRCVLLPQCWARASLAKWEVFPVQSGRVRHQ